MSTARPWRLAVALAAAITALAVSGPPAASTSAAATSSTAPGPSLRSLIVQNTVAGFDVSSNPELNGPITAGTLGNLIQNSQSSSVVTEIEELMQKPGFSSYVRVWSDAGGQIPTENEIEVGVFELPSEGSVNNLLLAIDPTSGQHTSAAKSAVNGIPTGYFETFATEDPVLASVADEYGTGADLNFYRTIQIVWFSAGRYIGIVKVLSADSSANRDQPHYDQVVALATEQYALLTSSPAGRNFDTIVIVRVVLGIVAAGVIVFIVLYRRKRTDLRDQLFASLGHSGDGRGGSDPKRGYKLPPLREGPTVAMIGHDRRGGGSRDQSGPWDRRAQGSAEQPGGVERRRGGSRDESGPWDRRAQGSAGPPGGVERRRGGSAGPPGGVERRRGGSREQPVPRERRRSGSRLPPPGGVERRRQIEVDMLLGLPSAAPASPGDVPGSAEPGILTSGSDDEMVPDLPDGDGKTPAGVDGLPEPAAGTPAGWLPDPSTHSRQLRYWDGQSWTTHVALPTA